MATCKYCEKSGWFLSLTSEGLCGRCVRTITPLVKRAIEIMTESDEIISKSKKLETKLSRLELIENTAKEYLLPIERKGIKPANQSSYQILDKVTIMRKEVIENTLQEYLNEANDKAKKAKSSKSKINAYSKMLQKITELKGKLPNLEIISDFESNVKILLDDIQPNAFADTTKDATKMVEIQKTKKRLSYARKHLPLPGYFSEISICIRKLIRERRKQKQDYDDLLTELYKNTIYEYFFLTTPCLELAGINNSVLHSITYDIIDKIEFSYDKIGYKALGHLKKNDIKWLVEKWGEPSQHINATDYNKPLWDSTVERFKSAIEKEDEKFERYKGEVLNKLSD